MDHIGIDVHKNECQVCIRTETRQLVERRVRTDRDSFAKWLGKRNKARILVESSTESEWVARCLEEARTRVIVADPNFAPMYAQRSRKVKTDRRDARVLCEACEARRVSAGPSRLGSQPCASSPGGRTRSARADADPAHQSDSRVAEAGRLPSAERRSRHVFRARGRSSNCTKRSKPRWRRCLR